jgi:hypothetical protein
VSENNEQWVSECVSEDEAVSGQVDVTLKDARTEPQRHHSLTRSLTHSCSS